MTIFCRHHKLEFLQRCLIEENGFDNLMQYLSINDKMTVKLIPLSSRFPNKMKTWILLREALCWYSSVSKLYDVEYDWRQFETFSTCNTIQLKSVLKEVSNQEAVIHWIVFSIVTKILKDEKYAGIHPQFKFTDHRDK